MTGIPTHVTFRHLAPSDSLEADIHERVARLGQSYAGIMGCKVLVELPHRHRQSGRHFHVRVEVTVPGGDPIVVNHEPSLHGPLKDLAEAVHRKDTEIEAVHRHARVAVHEAFDAARRQLQDFAREQRKAVKVHQEPAHGEVVELSKPDGFGFILSGEHRIYFNRASVLGEAFDGLVEGARVAFFEEQGEPIEEPLAQLERELIGAYLAGAGQDRDALLARDDDSARKLMAEASRYAAATLAQAEARMHYLRHLRGEP